MGVEEQKIENKKMIDSQAVDRGFFDRVPISAHVYDDRVSVR
jgi:hypothetical protein